MRHWAPLLLILTTGCANTLDKLAFQYDVPQGNSFDQSQINQLQPGMTQTEVANILGTPLILDPFHAARWDYLYRLNSSRGVVIQTHVALFFDKEGKLTKISGQMAPHTS
jgi:outer membrane protein assembly factor BamE